jgi:ketosteroid isomerase-like protein
LAEPILDPASARQILESAHAAWEAGDLLAVLRFYVDDCVYCSITGGLEGAPFILEGKTAYRDYLAPIMRMNQTVSTVINFSYVTGIGRARIAIYIKHRETGHQITSTYRQIVTYRDNCIARIDEYHDVARLSSFWRLAQRDSMAES